MVKYKKIFLNKIKLLLLYFMKFFDNRSILSKIYSKDCIVNSPNQKLIIIITYDKSIFFINNN